MLKLKAMSPRRKRALTSAVYVSELDSDGKRGRQIKRKKNEKGRVGGESGGERERKLWAGRGKDREMALR